MRRSPRPPAVVTKRKLRDALGRAYRALRNDPSSRDNRLRLAELLVDTPRRDLVRRHVRRVAERVPGSWGGGARLGELLFRIGEFDGAYRMIAWLVEHGCVDVEAIRTLSALCYRRGDPRGAQRYLSAAAWLNPIDSPQTTDPSKPVILRLRSVEGSRYAIRQNRARGTYLRRLKNGHFSVQDFLDKSSCNLFVGNYSGDNLLLTDDLPPFRLIINTVACPDLMAGPLHGITRFLERFPDIPVINDPARLLLTTRAGNAERLGALDGVRFPRTVLVPKGGSPDTQLAALEAAGFGYPIILRRAGTQTGDSMERLDSRGAARGYLDAATPGADIYAIEYLDLPGEDGFYHKTRCFFIDRKFYPIANLTSDDWQIHSGDRYRVMSKTPATQAEEQAYLSDPKGYLGARAFRALGEISRLIDLDFFGIDFTLDRDGGIVVFEANAAMRHNFDHAGNFPYTRPHLERASRAFQDMVERRLAESPAAVRRSA